MEQNSKLLNDFAKLTAMFEASGAAVNDEVMQLMQPLLSGEMTLEQHEAWLLEQIEAASGE